MKIGYPNRVIVTENTIDGSTKHPKENKNKLFPVQHKYFNAIHVILY